jgi:ABC-type polysaccharide/polyol phosphate transport system ATPase subunit
MSAIAVENLGKRFFLKHEVQRSLKSTILSAFRGRSLREEFWALRNVNFTVEIGQTLGIIGANGAGKSTLLGLLAGTMKPTEGSVRVQGKVSSLLELGAGFHPDLTGRENIYLNGAILGLSRDEIAKRFDRIVAFAELEDFIDTPVKHYSSGMYVRLGFAVAVEVDPDILLIDEVLAVGDETFRKKCLAKIDSFQKQGKTLLIVSHDLETVKKISEQALLLDEGSLLEIGQPRNVIDKYIDLGIYKQEDLDVKEWGNRDAEIKDIILLDINGQEKTRFKNGETIQVKINYDAYKRIDKPVFGYSIVDNDGKLIFGTNTQIAGIDVDYIEGKGSVDLLLDPNILIRGKFYFSFSLHSADHLTNYHRKENWVHFWMETDDDEIGFVRFPAKWKI